ncbi:MAG: 5,6-dimethylbenzimidazole synthase [Acidimicrobiales bacterium]
MVDHLTSERHGAAAPQGPDSEGHSLVPQVPLYDVILRRRDVRGEFCGEPVDPAVLRRVLSAAHAAPSVGLTQPWDFVVVTDPETRRAFHAHVQAERDRFAATLEGERAGTFAGIKIDGVVEASLSVVVTYDPDRGSPSVLGRHAIADAGLYSVCLAIENLWLACTAEGWGMGWVSFYQESFLSKLLGIPEPMRPVAWLCIGPVSRLADVPDLERHGWRERLPLEDVLHSETWEGHGDEAPILTGTTPIGGGLT